MRQVLRVDRVHAIEVGHVVKEDGGLNNSAEVAVGGLQNCDNVGENGILAYCELWIKYNLSDEGSQ